MSRIGGGVGYVDIADNVGGHGTLPDICARNLPETDGLEFHMIEPRSHLAQLTRQVSSVDSYFNVKRKRTAAHRLAYGLPHVPCR